MERFERKTGRVEYKMTNHRFIHIKSKITLEKLREDILDIGKQQLDDSIGVEPFNDKSYGKCLNVSFKPKPENIMIIWIDKEGVIEIRPDNFYGMDWLEATIRHELAYRYQAPIGDEGIGYETYKGIHNKYPTFESYAGRMKAIKGRKISVFERLHFKNTIKEIVKEYGKLFGDRK